MTNALPAGTFTGVSFKAGICNANSYDTRGVVDDTYGCGGTNPTPTPSSDNTKYSLGSTFEAAGPTPTATLFPDASFGNPMGVSRRRQNSPATELVPDKCDSFRSVTYSMPGFKKNQAGAAVPTPTRDFAYLNVAGLSTKSETGLDTSGPGAMPNHDIYVRSVTKDKDGSAVTKRTLSTTVVAAVSASCAASKSTVYQPAFNWADGEGNDASAGNAGTPPPTPPPYGTATDYDEQGGQSCPAKRTYCAVNLMFFNGLGATTCDNQLNWVSQNQANAAQNTYVTVMSGTCVALSAATSVRVTSVTSQQGAFQHNKYAVRAVYYQDSASCSGTPQTFNTRYGGGQYGKAGYYPGRTTSATSYNGNTQTDAFGSSFFPTPWATPANVPRTLQATPSIKAPLTTGDNYNQPESTFSKQGPQCQVVDDGKLFGFKLCTSGANLNLPRCSTGTPMGFTAVPVQSQDDYDVALSIKDGSPNQTPTLASDAVTVTSGSCMKRYFDQSTYILKAQNINRYDTYLSPKLTTYKYTWGKSQDAQNGGNTLNLDNYGGSQYAYGFDLCAGAAHLISTYAPQFSASITNTLDTPQVGGALSAVTTDTASAYTVSMQGYTPSAGAQDTIHFKVSCVSCKSTQDMPVYAGPTPAPVPTPATTCTDGGLAEARKASVKGCCSAENMYTGAGTVTPMLTKWNSYVPTSYIGQTAIGNYDILQTGGTGDVGLCATDTYSSTIRYTFCASRIQAGCGASTINACAGGVTWDGSNTCCRVQCEKDSKYDAFVNIGTGTQTGPKGARVLFAKTAAQYGQSIAPGYLTISTISYLDTVSGSSTPYIINNPIDWSAGGSGYQAQMNFHMLGQSCNTISDFQYCAQSITRYQTCTPADTTVVPTPQSFGPYAGEPQIVSKKTVPLMYYATPQSQCTTLSASSLSKTSLYFECSYTGKMQTTFFPQATDCTGTYYTMEEDQNMCISDPSTFGVPGTQAGYLGNCQFSPDSYAVTIKYILKPVAPQTCTTTWDTTSSLGTTPCKCTYGDYLFPSTPLGVNVKGQYANGKAEIPCASQTHPAGACATASSTKYTTPVYKFPKTIYSSTANAFYQYSVGASQTYYKCWDFTQESSECYSNSVPSLPPGTFNSNQCNKANNGRAYTNFPTTTKMAGAACYCKDAGFYPRTPTIAAATLKRLCSTSMTTTGAKGWVETHCSTGTASPSGNTDTSTMTNRGLPKRMASPPVAANADYARTSNACDCQLAVLNLGTEGGNAWTCTDQCKASNRANPAPATGWLNGDLTTAALRDAPNCDCVGYTKADQIPAQAAPTTGACTGTSYSCGIPAVDVSYIDAASMTGGDMTTTGVTIASGSCYSDKNNLGDNLSVIVQCTSLHDCLTTFYRSLDCTGDSVKQIHTTDFVTGGEWIVQTPYSPKDPQTIATGTTAFDYQSTSCLNGDCSQPGAPYFSVGTDPLTTYITVDVDGTGTGTQYTTTVDFQLSAIRIGADNTVAQGQWSRCRGYPSAFRSDVSDDSGLADSDIYGIAFGCFFIGFLCAGITTVVASAKVTVSSSASASASGSADPVATAGKV